MVYKGISEDIRRTLKSIHTVRRRKKKKMDRSGFINLARVAAKDGKARNE